MPLYIPKDLPAFDLLKEEGIHIDIQEKKANAGEPRLKVGLLNLMPLKIETETDFIRLLAKSELKIELTLIRFSSHRSRNTPEAHLNEFYSDFYAIKEQEFDGLIITGAPVEHLPFEQVSYWKELEEVFEWSKTHVKSTLNICWAAQAGLYHFYNINKHELQHKMFGIFEHRVLDKNCPLLNGFNSNFNAPHSRHTEIKTEDINNCAELELLAASDQAGVFIVSANAGQQFFVTGHAEYPLYRLDGEYKRDLSKGLEINAPINYYKNNDSTLAPIETWGSHANLLFMNWLNHYVNK